MDPTELFPWLLGGGTVLTVLFTIFIILCTTLPIFAIFGGIGWYIYKQSQKAKAVQAAAQAWLATQGTILKSRVEVSGGDHTSVSAYVLYEYQVGAQMYQGDRVRPADAIMRIGTSRSAYETVDRYPVGDQVTVYYNPANPAESALER